MTELLQVTLPDEKATAELGRKLSGLTGLIFLYGELGAGKTTLVRGFLRGLGHDDAVKSPTYTLVEPYHLGGRCIFHLDIYRLSDVEELYFLGIRDDLGDATNTFLVEWPERAQGALGEPIATIHLDYEGEARRARIQVNSDDARKQLQLAAGSGPALSSKRN